MHHRGIFMRHSENNFTAHDGLELYCQAWRPDGRAKASLTIIHGIGEHSGRFMNLVHPLVSHGYAVYGFDARGHGHSPGRRGHVNSFAEFRYDVNVFLEQVVAVEDSDIPKFVLGRSLGGLIALDTVLHQNRGLAGVIVSSPALDAGGISPALMFIARLLSKLWPTLSFKTGLDVTGISRDPAVVDAYRTDPMVHGKGTPRLATESTAAMEWCLQHGHELQIPILVLNGSADRITSPIASGQFFDRVVYEDKTRRVYDGGYHESLNDLQHALVAHEIESWMEARLQGKA